MEASLLLSEAVSVIGLVAGVAGFVLGVLNYLRDRHKIVVALQWDLAATPSSGYDANKPWGLITVTNIGRRSSHVSHVALRLPKGCEHSHLLIMGGIAGKKLTEGDPAEVFVVDQAGLDQYARDWQKIVAQVSDSTGKVWSSTKLKSAAIPSWAKIHG